VFAAYLLIERLHPDHLLPTVIFTSGLLSAFLVTDIVCLVMTPFFIHIARVLRRPQVPYVIAVATPSKYGKKATITGNPQNMLIGSLSGIRYAAFLGRLAPVAIVGLFINWALIHRIYLRGEIDDVAVAPALADPEFQQGAHPQEAGCCPRLGARRIPRRRASSDDSGRRCRRTVDYADGRSTAGL